MLLHVGADQLLCHVAVLEEVLVCYKHIKASAATNRSSCCSEHLFSKPQSILFVGAVSFEALSHVHQLCHDCLTVVLTSNDCSDFYHKLHVQFLNVIYASYIWTVSIKPQECVAESLEWCMQIIHMDLKSKNILLNRDHTLAKIADVGLSRGMLQTLPYVSFVFLRLLWTPLAQHMKSCLHTCLANLDSGAIAFTTYVESLFAQHERAMMLTAELC